MVNQVHAQILHHLKTNLQMARSRMTQGDPFDLVVGGMYLKIIKTIERKHC